MKRNVKLILVSIVVLFIVVGTIFWFVNNKESDIANKEENNEVEETNNENNVLDNNDNDNNSNDENNEPKLVNPIEVLDIMVKNVWRSKIQLNGVTVYKN